MAGSMEGTFSVEEPMKRVRVESGHRRADPSDCRCEFVLVYRVEDGRLGSDVAFVGTGRSAARSWNGFSSLPKRWHSSSLGAGIGSRQFYEWRRF